MDVGNYNFWVAGMVFTLLFEMKYYPKRKKLDTSS